MNRAKPAATVDVTGAQRVAFKTKHTPLLDTFRGTTGKVVGDGIWKERGVATLKYDQEGAIISVEIENTAAANLEEMFGKMCDEGALYQLQLPDFDLLTTQNACMYKERGLNETLTFYTDDLGKNLISFSYNLIDYEYLATKEKYAKTRRLMTTPEWGSFMTQADLSAPVFYSQPSFGRKNYDSKGHEKKETVKDAEGKEKKPEEEASFFSKYWLYILMAFLILPRLFEQAPAESGDGTPAAAPARR